LETLWFPRFYIDLWKNSKMYSLEFISIGCNRFTNCIDWGQNNLIAYGAHTFVAIYDPEVCTVFLHKNLKKLHFKS
jgi:hypothetical protein